MKQSEIMVLVDRIVTGAMIQVQRDGGVVEPEMLVDIARDELERAKVPLQQKRTAVVLNPRALISTVKAYLPVNYEARVNDDGLIEIKGYDMAGWTLHEYVIPRLGSGMIVATEVVE